MSAPAEEYHDNYIPSEGPERRHGERRRQNLAVSPERRQESRRQPEYAQAALQDMVEFDPDLDLDNVSKELDVTNADLTVSNVESRFNYKDEIYAHLQTREVINPTLARMAWHIHAIGYQAEGFVDRSAIHNGYFVDGIDHARGPLVDYHLSAERGTDFEAEELFEKDYAATLRIFNLAAGQDYQSLPGYEHCAQSLFLPGRAKLEAIRDPEHRLKEISALATAEWATSVAAHEIFRRVILEAQGKGEIWFFSVVSTTYDKLAAVYGAKNFEVIGYDTPIKNKHVNPAVTLRPTLMYPDEFVPNILDCYEDFETMVTPPEFYAPDSQQAKRWPAIRRQAMMRLRSRYLFFTNAMPIESMSEHLREGRERMLADMSKRQKV